MVVLYDSTVYLYGMVQLYMVKQRRNICVAVVNVDPSIGRAEERYTGNNRNHKNSEIVNYLDKHNNLVELRSVGFNINPSVATPHFFFSLFFFKAMICFFFFYSYYKAIYSGQYVEMNCCHMATLGTFG